MKKVFVVLVMTITCGTLYAQLTGGTIIRKKFTATSLLSNQVGESPERNVSVYLPPGYESSTQSYPVIYFLHGYTGNDSLLMNEWLHMKMLLDTAILSGKISPVIFVAPNSYTKLGGSFYTNSDIAGKWADYIAIDVVKYIDANFKTIPKKESRGLAGHSMGGFGALKIGMQYANVFGVVYSLSPAMIDWYGDFSIDNPAFYKAATYESEEDAMSNLHTAEGFYATIFNAMGRAFSSSTGAGKLQIVLPVILINNKRVIDEKVLRKWNKELPYNMIETYKENLLSLTALKIDWGRNEEFLHIPVTAMRYSKKLEKNNIPHFAEEYLGNHNNMQNGFNGRIYTELLPFFNDYLNKQ